MARPSSTPRLRDIDPIAFGRNVAGRVLEHATSLLLKIDLGANWKLEGAPFLELEARMLALYARRGLIGDWTDHGCAADALVSVCAGLYSQASRPGVIGGPDDADVDPTDEIGVVLLAAQARIRIDRKQRVPVRELACLASVEPQHVRLLGRQGEIEIEDGSVRAAECRRWLSARGVDGV